MTSGFFLYPSYVRGIKEILSLEQYQAYIVALVELGLGSRVAVKDPIVRALLVDKLVAIRATNRRNKRSKINGAKGGRKKQFTRKQMENAVRSHGITSVKGLADYLGCSTRTVNRCITSEEIKNIVRSKSENEV